MFKNTGSKWGIVAQSLHWLVFLIFVNQFVTAEVMMDLAAHEAALGFGKWALYGFHKSVGVVLLLLVFLRITWRLYSPAPKDIETNSPVENKLAHTMHFALYLVMLAFPLSGYVMSMAGGHGISVFGLFDLPNFIGLNKELGGLAHSVHGIAGLVAYVLVGLHVLAALKHHFITKDSTLRRMLPWG